MSDTLRLEFTTSEIQSKNVEETLQHNFYNEIYQKVKAKGKVSNPRGLAVKELYSESIYVPLSGNIHILDYNDEEENSIYLRYLIGELLWYFIDGYEYFENGKPKANIMNIEKFASLWKRIADGNNEVYSNYGLRILYKNQFVNCFNELLKDRDSRRGVILFQYPEQDKNAKEYTCTMYANFFIRDNKLKMIVHMRSQDVNTGLKYDFVFFQLLYYEMFINLKKHFNTLAFDKEFILSVDNIHLYTNDTKTTRTSKCNVTVKKVANVGALQLPFYNIKNNKVYMDKKDSEKWKTINEFYTSEDINSYTYKQLKELFLLLLNL